MTYLQFLLLCVVPPLAALSALTVRWALRHATREQVVLSAWVLAAHVVAALVATTPWDNYLVYRGVWSYPPGRVLFVIGYVPFEEYLFFVLQTLLGAQLTLALLRARPGSLPPSGRAAARGGRRVRALGAAALLVSAGAGAVMLARPGGLYLGLILVWAGPILALQWAFGGDLLVRRRGPLALAIGSTTLWLAAADRLALHLGIWSIAPDASTGLTLLGLPLEEGVFFLVTNVLVAFGVTLAADPSAPARWRSLRRSLTRRLRRVALWQVLLLAWAGSMVPTPLLPAAFPLLAYLSTLFLALGLLALAWRRAGPRAGAAFLVALAFGWGVEWLGSATGVPFGAYRYAAPGPAVLGVPLLVPLGWWAFTLLAVASVPARAARWAAPLALVAWDVGLDPLMVHHGFWRFEPAGPFYGVPWLNFVGWAVCGFLLVEILRRVAPGLARVRGRATRTVFAAQAVFMTAGLAWYGLPWAAVATSLGMGTVIATWSAGTRRWLPGRRAA